MWQLLVSLLFSDFSFSIFFLCYSFLDYLCFPFLAQCYCVQPPRLHFQQGFHWGGGRQRDTPPLIAPLGAVCHDHTFYLLCCSFVCCGLGSAVSLAWCDHSALLGGHTSIRHHWGFALCFSLLAQLVAACCGLNRPPFFVVGCFLDS